MSSAAVLAQESIRLLRRDEYEKLAGLGLFDDERVELLEGVLSATSPQSPAHQWSIVAATRYLVGLFGDRADVRVQLPFAATDDSEPEPDFAIVPPAPGIAATPTAALLVIEISDSTLKRDRDIKSALYARAGVPEYWIVDVARGVVEVRTRPDGGVYNRLETLDRTGRARPVAFPDLELDLSQFVPRPATG